MVTPEELASQQAKAREPIKPVEAPVEDEIEEEPAIEDGEGETSDEEGSVIDDDDDAD